MEDWMNSRERFRGVMEYRAVDRVPWLEEGVRDDVVERWGRQGMPAAGAAAVFAYDRRERVEVDLGLRSKGRKGLVCREELPEWRRNLERPLEERLGADWAGRVARWRGREHLLELPLHSGLFLTMGADDWGRLEGLMYMLADEPGVVEEAMGLQGELARRVTERVCGEVELDMVSVSEPIGGNSGPLVGPGMYGRVALGSYRGALGVARGARVPGVVFMTYANAHCLWAMETEGAGMDYRALRKEFGKGLRLIGGIDLDALLAGEGAIEREMKEVVPWMVEAGGCVPLADGRVRATVGWREYCYYRRLLERMTVNDQ